MTSITFAAVICDANLNLSLATSCVLFDIALTLLVGLKKLMLNKRRRWFHSSCEVAHCQYVCELVFDINVFDLDFWVQVDSVKQPIKSNSVVAGHVSHWWTSAFDDHLDHRFVIFNNVGHRARTRRFRV